jgi:regulatory protein YycI of two-component signal transduction system YycFG
MRVIVGIIIGVFIAGMYFNPEVTKEKIANGADWVKEQVSDDPIKNFLK